MLFDRPIARNHGESHPTQLTFVSAHAQALPSVKSDCSETLVWQSGHCQSVRMENDTTTRTVTLSLKSPLQFWDHIRTRVSTSRPVWVFAYDIPHTFTLLGGWQKWRQGIIGVRWDEIAWDFPGAGIRQDKCKPGLIVDNDPPVIFDLWHQAGGRIVFVDTRNYWNVAKQQFDSPGDECEYVKDKIIGLWREHKARKLGNWTYTAAGLGWNAWRHAFMTQPVFIHGDPDCDELERTAYYGGWTETFYAGTIRKPLAQLDVNGMYPFIMGTRRLPIQLERFEDRPYHNDEELFSSPIQCIAEVSIRSETELFPRRTGFRSSELTTGTFDTVLCGPELLRAVETRSIVAVRRWAKYRIAVTFAEFARYMHEMKRDARELGNADAALLVKAMSVGLYGRFARRTPKWIDVADECELPDKAWILTPQQLENWRHFTGSDGMESSVVRGTASGNAKALRIVGRHWQKMVGTERHKDSFPAIAAFVTAWGREYLRGIVDIAHADSVYRVATDSVIVDEAGYDRLMTAKMLHETNAGMLKLEKFGRDAEFRGVHSFRLGEHVVHGGLSSQLERQPDGSYRDYRTDRLETLIRSQNSAAIRRFFVDIPANQAYDTANKATGCRLPIKRISIEREWTDGQSKRDPGETNTGHADR